MKRINIKIFFILSMSFSTGASAQSVTLELKELQAGKEYNKTQVQTFLISYTKMQIRHN